jgi:hypothetical protein
MKKKGYNETPLPPGYMFTTMRKSGRGMTVSVYLFYANSERLEADLEFVVDYVKGEMQSIHICS